MWFHRSGETFRRCSMFDYFLWGVPYCFYLCVFKTVSHLQWPVWGAWFLTQSCDHAKIMLNSVQVDSIFAMLLWWVSHGWIPGLESLSVSFSMSIMANFPFLTEQPCSVGFLYHLIRTMLSIKLLIRGDVSLTLWTVLGFKISHNERLYLRKCYPYLLCLRSLKFLSFNVNRVLAFDIMSTTCSCRQVIKEWSCICYFLMDPCPWAYGSFLLFSFFWISVFGQRMSSYGFPFKLKWLFCSSCVKFLCIPLEWHWRHFFATGHICPRMKHGTRCCLYIASPKQALDSVCRLFVFTNRQALGSPLLPFGFLLP
jgi:hypothetical protein